MVFDMEKTFQSKIKDSTDFIYSLVATEAEGYRGGFNSMGRITKMVVTALVKRGILTREKDTSKSRGFVYRWAGPMPPTRVLYGNIVADIRAAVSQKNKAYEARRKAMVEARKAQEETKAITLEDYSIQELWDELKRRGCTIEDNRLVLKTTTVFE